MKIAGVEKKTGELLRTDFFRLLKIRLESQNNYTKNR